MIEEAIAFARKAHAGQKRRDGSDYFENHIKHVGEAVQKVVADWELTTPEYKECVVTAAYLHDVLEDTAYSINHFGPIVKDLVLSVTRQKSETYFDFIMRINRSKILGAKAIKLADLRHNMSTLEECSMKDKYRFAEYILVQV